MNNSELLQEKAFAGLEERGLSSDQIYIERLEYELETVKKLEFTTYFLVMWDIAKFARREGILYGPARGSGAASLLNYCLRITMVDPIKYKLPYERFMSPDRESPPDVDWDTADREKIITYLEEKYGKDRVARVGSINFLRTKSAIRDVGRVLEKEYAFVEELADLVPPPVAGLWDSFEAEAKVQPKLLDKKYSDIMEPAKALWGVTRSYGTHAGGVAIAPCPINRVIPLYKDKDGNPVSQFDYRDLEAAGLLKFDILGLSTLEVIQLCLKYMKQDGHEINLEDLEDEDEKAYDLIRSGDLDGIFQLGGSESIKQLTVSIAPRSIEDLSLVTSLFRPGPLAAKVDTKAGKMSMAQAAVETRQGNLKTEYLHDSLIPVLENTYGIPLYQEQIMGICTNLCSYTLPESYHVMKMLGKKQQKKMEAEKPKFISGVQKNGIPEREASELFEQLKVYSQYLFNRCLTEDTQVLQVDEFGDGYPTSLCDIKEQLAAKKEVSLASFLPAEERTCSDHCLEVIDTGKQEVFEIQLSDGSTVQCTMNHKFLCSDKRKHTLQEIIQKDLDIISAERTNCHCMKKLKISSIRRVGKKQTYNLRMKGDQHNFLLANGIVSSNSHAVAYSFITYWTAYLKAHFPIHYYSALLACEKNPDMIIQFASSIKEAGISILPPDVNLSGVYHAPERGEGKAIRFGLAHIKGMPLSVAEDLVRIRDGKKTQPMA